jgi:hypothetical protein
VPIETMVLVEARVFGSDDRVLEIERDLGERDEVVAFVIGRVVNPCLEVALHVDRGGWRVDPAGSYEEQNRKRPKKRRGDEKPLNEEADRALPGRSGRGNVWNFRHTSE